MRALWASGRPCVGAGLWMTRVVMRYRARRRRDEAHAQCQKSATIQKLVGQSV